jgi:hypothetical protein
MRTHLGGVEGRLQGNADGTPKVHATDDTQHDPLLPAEATSGRLDAHTDRVALYTLEHPHTYSLLFGSFLTLVLIHDARGYTSPYEF